MLKINKPTRKIMLAVFYVVVFLLSVWLPLPKPQVLAA